MRGSRRKLFWALLCGAVALGGCKDRPRARPDRRRATSGLDAPSQAAARGWRFVELAVGQAHGCAIDDRARLWCWGDNRRGELGDGTRTSRGYLKRALLDEPVRQVTVQPGRTCARLQSGKVRCFGLTAGKVAELAHAVWLAGDCAVAKSGAVTCSHGPVPEWRDVTRLAWSMGHMCALRRTGEVSCIGDNISGQVGLPPLPRNHRLLRSRQHQPRVPGVVQATDVAVGERHSCAVHSGGRVRCWGSPFGRVTLAHLTDAVAVRAMGYNTCVQLRDRTLRCFGYNREGQLGVQDAKRGALVKPPVGAVERFDVAAKRVCVLRQGDVYCWGAREHAARTPGRVKLADVRLISARDTRTCAVTTRGELYCWGKLARWGGPRRFGSEHLLAPKRFATGVRQLSTGSHDVNQVCVVKADGRVACLDATQRWIEPGVREAVDVSVGSSHSCAVARAGTVHCWGANQDGALGDGTRQDRSGPSTVLGIKDARQVVAGVFFSCALRRSGRVSCWGNNRLGTLGTRDQTPTAVPGDVPGVTGAVALAGGPYGACARLRGGKVSCWGLVVGHGGEAGPRVVPALEGAKALSFGDTFVCGIRGGGPICYQRYESALLGKPDDGRGQRPRGVAKAIAVTGGRSHACALTPGGRVLCWGENDEGQLGLGVGRHLPWRVPVSTDRR